MREQKNNFYEYNMYFILSSTCLKGSMDVKFFIIICHSVHSLTSFIVRKIISESLWWRHFILFYSLLLLHIFTFNRTLQYPSVFSVYSPSHAIIKMYLSEFLQSPCQNDAGETENVNRIARRTFNRCFDVFLWIELKILCRVFLSFVSVKM